jgi:hypothetical protein
VVPTEEDEFWFALAEQQDRQQQQQQQSMDLDNPAPTFTVDSTKKKFDKAAVREADTMMWFGGDHEEEQTEAVGPIRFPFAVVFRSRFS